MPRSTSDIIRHAEELADLVESDKVNLDRASPEVTQAYKELLAAVIERGKAEEDVTRAIAKLRRAGGSWNLIGQALGVSRQSSREQYALVDDGDRTRRSASEERCGTSWADNRGHPTRLTSTGTSGTTDNGVRFARSGIPNERKGAPSAMVRSRFARGSGAQPKGATNVQTRGVDGLPERAVRDHARHWS